MCRKHTWLGLGLLVLAGCYAPVRPDIDALICTSASRPLDLQPVTGTAPSASTLHPLGKNALDAPIANRPDEEFESILLASMQDKKADVPQPKGPSLLERLKIPPELEGSERTHTIKIPLNDQKKPDLPKLAEMVKKYFPPLPDIGPDPKPVPGPNGLPLTLADLQQLAQANSPQLREAAAAVEAARGAMIQAGVYTNPTIGLQGAGDGPSGGPTFGPTLGETITTMGKKKLAQAMAQMDLENARLAYRRAETDLMATVRTGYFSVLTGLESIRQNRALVVLTDELYNVMVDRLRGGEQAVYEPMQVAVFAGQARAALIQARNGYTLAWKQLAAGMGLVNMPPTELLGKITQLPIPQFRYDTCLAHVLANHTDVGTAINGIAKARYALRLAEVTPIPDITVQLGLTFDETQPGPNRALGTFAVTAPIPVFDLNKGGVLNAKALLVQANEEPHRVQDDLTGRVADAFRRYNENFDLLDLYLNKILPDQVQAYRSSVERYFGGDIGGLAYNDVITAEQNLVSVVGNYLGVLQAQWQAVSDLGSLLQTNDIFQLAEGKCFVQAPDLSQLLQLPCCHPCSTLPGSHLLPPDLSWPEAGFSPKATATGALGAPVPAAPSPSFSARPAPASNQAAFGAAKE
jgi:cobalt-zinc-cadmium efflux system outer membrane protein